MGAAAMVSEVREAAGLSRRALAARAGVPTSTVSRIEDGRVDPTVTMLERLVGAAGHQLVLDEIERPATPSIAGLADATDPVAAGGIDWTRLRAFLDWTELHTDQVPAAITVPPARSGNEVLDTLLAAIAEKIADDRHEPRPRWCTAVPALPRRWLPPGTPRMTEPARRTAPRQLKARNIFVAERDLWRHA